jgi:hypothetical protein
LRFITPLAELSDPVSWAITKLTVTPLCGVPAFSTRVVTGTARLLPGAIHR